MTNQEFEQQYYPRYASLIKAIARKLAFSNDALMDDLEALGMDALWKCDPTKAKTNEDAFIRQAVKFRMIDFLRKERPHAYESLSAHLDRGAQVVKDPVTGEVLLIALHERHRRSTLTDDAMAAGLRLVSEDEYDPEPVGEDA